MAESLEWLETGKITRWTNDIFYTKEINYSCYITFLKQNISP